MNKKCGLFYEVCKNKCLTIMVMPMILYVFVLSYIPMGGIVIAFQKFYNDKGIFGSPFIGFENFRFFFSSGSALRLTVNTLKFNILFLLFNMVLQLITAIVLSELIGKYFKKITQTMMLMPFFISWVVAGAIVFNIFDYDIGIVNTILREIGLQPIAVYNEPQYWNFILVIFSIWKNIGYGTVVYLAVISGLDQEIFESANIDGANIYQKAFSITLPCLKPTAIILILLGLGNIIRGDFAMFYNLTGNSPMLYPVTDIIDTYVFRGLQGAGDFGMAAASGLYQSIVGFFTIITVNTIIKKVQPDYSLF